MTNNFFRSGPARFTLRKLSTPLKGFINNINPDVKVDICEVVISQSIDLTTGYTANIRLVDLFFGNHQPAATSGMTTSFQKRYDGSIPLGVGIAAVLGHYGGTQRVTFYIRPDQYAADPEIEEALNLVVRDAVASNQIALAMREAKTLIPGSFGLYVALVQKDLQLLQRMTK